MAGWLKLHRTISDWEWYTDANVMRLFLHLLIKANYKPSRFRGFDVPVGSVVAGRTALSAQLGMSEQQVRTALDKLLSTNEITINSTNKFSIISICCWDKYQDDNQQDNHQVTNKQPTDNQQVTTSKEGNKDTREEGKNITAISEPIQFAQWYESYPRKIGKKAAEKAFNSAIKSGVTIEQLTQGVAAYNQEIKDAGTSTQYIKHPSTWLNQGCYDDDHAQIVHDNAGRDNKKPRSIFEIGDEVAARMGWE